MSKTEMPVASAIKELRAQLTEAMTAGETEKLRFRIRDIELELELIYQDKIEGGVKLGWHIFSLGGAASSRDTKTHKLRLTMGVTDEKGQAISIRDED